MSDKIKITFPDGSVKEYDKGITAIDIAKSISNKFADSI
ncbi:MAG: TGS domain-containing protein, partial [Ignavibacteriae bacterium]|nr:TGS domain-containing protein [Ignavibacteriota bacterium]